jgi:hypothetical protein
MSYLLAGLRANDVTCSTLSPGKKVGESPVHSQNSVCLGHPTDRLFVDQAPIIYSNGPLAGTENAPNLVV